MNFLPQHRHKTTVDHAPVSESHTMHPYMRSLRFLLIVKSSAAILRLNHNLLSTVSCSGVFVFFTALDKVLSVHFDAV